MQCAAPYCGQELCRQVGRDTLATTPTPLSSHGPELRSETLQHVLHWPVPEMEVSFVAIAHEDNEILSVNFKVTVKNIIHLLMTKKLFVKVLVEAPEGILVLTQKRISCVLILTVRRPTTARTNGNPVPITEVLEKPPTNDDHNTWLKKMKVCHLVLELNVVLRRLRQPVGM